MAYQRAQWHSGLTYCQTCDTCKTEVVYTDFSLDFRPWDPDGYVDCPKCKSHLRHNEEYAINAPQSTPVVVASAAPAGSAAFCAECGNKFSENARFCAMCGAKRT